MDTVRSADGTTIAFDRFGSGPPLIFVVGVALPLIAHDMRLDAATQGLVGAAAPLGARAVGGIALVVLASVGASRRRQAPAPVQV